MATMKPIQFEGHTIKLTEAGFLGYVHYDCTRDADGKSVARGGISRDNYNSSRAHRAAILATCRKSVAAAEVLTGEANGR